MSGRKKAKALHVSGKQIARAIFSCGDDPGRPVQRIQFLGGEYPGSETEQGGLCEIALANLIQSVIDCPPTDGGDRMRDKTTIEIDRLHIALSDSELIVAELDELTSYQDDLITTLRATITRLQAALDALRQFSTHRHNCGLSKALNHPSYTGKCNCGLTKALAKADGGEL